MSLLRTSRRRPARLQHRLGLSALENRAVPALFTVTLAGDAGNADPMDPASKGDIRYVLNLANTNGVDDTIAFDAAITAVSLNSELPITESAGLTIDGGGKVTLSNVAAASATSRIFNIAAVGAPAIELKGLTLTGGNLSTGNGGAVLAANTNLVITDSTFTGNKTAGAGGALSTVTSGTTVTITNSAFTGNSAGSTGGAVNGVSTLTLNVTNSSFGSNTATSNGGAIHTAGAASVVLNSASVTNNKSSTNGGGLSSGGAGSTWTITLSQISGNQGSAGAGFRIASSPTITVDRSTISGNVGTGVGAGLYLVSTGNLTVTNSTIAGNVTSSNGGGISASAAATVVITNSTIANNEAKGTSGGGGITIGTASLTVNNSTIAGNLASNASGLGGGIRRTGATGSVTLNSTIVADNTANGAGGDDIHATNATAIAGGNNLVEDVSAGNFTLDGTNITGVDPLLSALAANGGPTETIALKAGSPALDQGSNVLGLTEDQRGAGFPRVLNAIPDVGAYEGFTTVPTAQATLPNVPPGGATYVATVAYSDDFGIDTSTIDVNDVVLSGPAFGSPVAPFKASFTGSGTSVTATYEFNVPGGSWEFTENGTYTLTMQPNQVFDLDGTPNAVTAGPLGTFQVSVPLPPLLVDNDGDVDDGNYGPGQLTLREAINLANGVPGTNDSISFDASLNGKTITLGSELKVSDGVTITGPGAAQLTVSANQAATLTIANSTFTANTSTTTGGAIHLGTGGVVATITNSVFDGNTATTTGGAIHTASTVTLNVADSTFKNNSGTQGGAMRITSGSSTVTINRSTVSGNFTTTGAGGGLYMFSGGSLTVIDSTFSGNTATTSGGGVAMASGATTITNSTISGNTANGTGTAGGGGVSVTTGVLTVNNSTLTANSSAGVGGGIRKTSATGTLTLSSTIVAANTATSGGADVNAASAIVIAGGDNLVGVADVGNFTLSGANQVGTAGTPLDPLLAGLANNGGPTQTHLPQAGSPAFNNGNNALALANDQRGSGFTRVLGSQADIGAVESVTVVPGAKATLPNVPPAGATYVATVEYIDETGINTATIDVNDVLLSGPAFGSPVAPFKASFTGSGTNVIATYEFNVPGGSWDFLENGTYTLTMQPNQVFDTDSTPNAVPAGKLGTFQVAIPLPPLVVDNDGDADDGNYGPGQLTLREAVNLANGVPGTTDSISFAPSLNGKTILLGTELDVTDALIITGPGASNLTISGGGLVRLFDVAITGVGGVFTVSGLTLTGGKATIGAVINATDDVITITGCVVTNSQGTSGNDSAPVLVNGTGGSLTVDDCWFDGNSAPGGGAVGVAGGAALTVTDSLFTNNTTTIGNTGGAVRANSTGATAIRNSTFIGNKAGFNGGGIGFGSAFTGNGLVQNCTLTGNIADSDNSNSGDGGGVGINTASTGQVTIESCIIFGNLRGELAQTPSDIFGADPITANFSLIGTTVGATSFTPDATTTALLGQDPLLDTLANNGGPTQTVALKAGSPAINPGSNPAALAFDQRGSGFARVVGGQADIGAFEVQAAGAPAKISAVEINGGVAQRSRVTSLKVTFDQAVTLPGNPADAFQLTRQAPAGSVTLAASVSGNSVTLTFTGGTVDADSLADGRYTLTVLAAQVNGGNFDGDGNGIPGDNFVLTGDPAANTLFRIFGDNDGDGDVDAQDFGAFRAAFGGTNNTFDFDNDGDVDAQDFGQFRARFGSSV
jgi:predicted outer membrane repeat protein